MIQRAGTTILCLVAILPLAITGCQTTGSVEGGQATRVDASHVTEHTDAGVACSLSGNSSYGLAIVSATLPPQEFHPGYPTGYSVKYNREGGLGLTDKLLLMDRERFFVKFSSDFSGVFGKLFVLRLQPGTYQFKSWTMASGLMTETPLWIHPLTFRVEAGRAVYLGGFDPSIRQGENLLHQTAYSSWILVHDDRSRDLPVFFRKCAGFDASLLDIRVMDPAPWLPPNQ